MYIARTRYSISKGTQSVPKEHPKCGFESACSLARASRRPLVASVQAFSASVHACAPNFGLTIKNSLHVILNGPRTQEGSFYRPDRFVFLKRGSKRVAGQGGRKAALRDATYRRGSDTIL